MKKALLVIGILVSVFFSGCAVDSLDGTYEEEIEQTFMKEVKTLEFKKNGDYKMIVESQGINDVEYLEITYGKYEIKDDLFIEELSRIELFKNGVLSKEVNNDPVVTYESKILLRTDSVLQIAWTNEAGKIFTYKYVKQ